MLFVHLLLLWFTPGSHDSMVSTIPGGGCTPLYGLYRYIYVRPQRVWFCFSAVLVINRVSIFAILPPFWS